MKKVIIIGLLVLFMTGCFPKKNVVTYIAGEGGEVMPERVLVWNNESVEPPVYKANDGYYFVNFEIISGEANATLNRRTGGLSSVDGNVTVQANFALIDGNIE